MKRLATRSIRIGAMLALVLGLSGGWVIAPAMAQTAASGTDEEGGEIEVSVSVISPVEGDAASGQVAGGTIATTLAAPQQPPTTSRDDVTYVDLVVADGRGTASGWQIQLLQPAMASRGEPLTLVRYQRRTILLAGQPLQGTNGPRGNRISIGQTLVNPTPVMVAAPDAGAGVYRVQLALGSLDALTEPAPLILSIVSAP